VVSPGPLAASSPLVLVKKTCNEVIALLAGLPASADAERRHVNGRELRRLNFQKDDVVWSLPVSSTCGAYFTP
jgi:hypothetical protein